MKNVIVLILAITIIFVFSGSNMYAQDSTQKDSVKISEKNQSKTDSSGQYQKFVDKNNNGIDDNLEKTQKQQTRVEPKKEAEKPQVPQNNQYSPLKSKEKTDTTANTNKENKKRSK